MPKIKSLIRHLLVAINPYSDLRNSDHFLSMFTALERVIEAAMKLDSTPCNPAASNDELISRLQGLIESVKADAGECADVVTARLDGFIKTVHSGVSWSDKFASFLRAYPEINHCRADLWPVIGRGQQRGLKEIRNALAHGRGSFISTDVIAVAKWHLAILMERLGNICITPPKP